MEGLRRLGVPPRSEEELVDRAEDLACLTVGELADALRVALPGEPERHKGFLGTLLERALGATAENRAVPDFERLGVELKSVPVDGHGKPQESTFLTRVAWQELLDTAWTESGLHKKTRRLLFIPVEADGRWPLSVRRIGRPLLWSPDPTTEGQLSEDYDRFALAVQAGAPESIEASWGTVVQMRPKAADSRRRSSYAVSTGDGRRLPPRGFYLRARFTRELFAQAYQPPEEASGG